MSDAARARSSLRLHGRSFIALALLPELPVMDWLTELDAQMERSPGFFTGRPVIVDLAAAPLRGPGLRALLQELQARSIRVIGLEGLPDAVRAESKFDLPPTLAGGRPTGAVEAPAPATEDTAAAPPEPPAPPEPAFLVLDQPVRSGQSVQFPGGDVTVVGAVASGAEVIAGGSIHVYGALRGRAIAGALGHAGARIFCRRLEAELIAIGDRYRTADDMDPGLIGRPVQIWRTDDQIHVAALDGAG